MKMRGGRGVTRGGMGAMSKSKAMVSSAMKEVHENVPSTVRRAKKFGPGGPEAMKRAVAFSKARKAGARVPIRKARSA